MKKIDIIRAWKDSAYRSTLTATELAALPTNPAGTLTDDDLSLVAGGAEQARPTHRILTLGCCPVTWGLFCGTR